MEMERERWKFRFHLKRRWEEREEGGRDRSIKGKKMGRVTENTKKQGESKKEKNTKMERDQHYNNKK